MRVMKNLLTLFSLAIVLVYFGIEPNVVTAESGVATSTTPAPLTQNEVEKRVREYFSDIPVMIEIARCESEFQHQNNDGSVLHGGFNNSMVGVFQFYKVVHTKDALALGLDLENLDDNLAYARHLYDTTGTSPWNSSRSCWKNSVTSSTVHTTSTDAELHKKIELLTQIIALLEQILQLQSKIATRM